MTCLQKEAILRGPTDVWVLIVQAEYDGKPWAGVIGVYDSPDYAQQANDAYCARRDAFPERDFTNQKTTIVWERVRYQPGPQDQHSEGQK